MSQTKKHKGRARFDLYNSDHLISRQQDASYKAERRKGEWTRQPTVNLPSQSISLQMDSKQIEHLVNQFHKHPLSKEVEAAPHMLQQPSSTQDDVQLECQHAKFLVKEGPALKHAQYKAEDYLCMWGTPCGQILDAKKDTKYWMDHLEEYHIEDLKLMRVHSWSEGKEVLTTLRQPERCRWASIVVGTGTRRYKGQFTLELQDKIQECGACFDRPSGYWREHTIIAKHILVNWA